MVALMDRRCLKESGVYSYNCNKLYKTDMLLAKISREFKNSRISTPPIDPSRPSRGPYHSLKSRCRCQNPHSELLCFHRYSMLTLKMTLNKTKYARGLVNQAIN